MLKATKLKSGQMTVTKNGRDIGFGAHDLIGSFGDVFVVRTDAKSRKTTIFSAQSGKCLIPDLRPTANSQLSLPVNGISTQMITSSAVLGIISSGFYGSPTTRGTIQIRQLQPEKNPPTKIISAGYCELNLTAGLFAGQSDYVVGKKRHDTRYGIFTKAGKKICESDDFHELAAGFVEGTSEFARVYAEDSAQIVNVLTGECVFEIELPFRRSISEHGLVSDGFQNGVSWTSIGETFFAVHETGKRIDISAQVRAFLDVNDNAISSQDFLALSANALTETKPHRLL